MRNCLLLLVTACGAAPPALESPEPTPSDPGPTPADVDGPTLPPAPYAPAPVVYAAPAQLSFYAEDVVQVQGPRFATVTNGTESFLLITYAYIRDPPEEWYVGGAEGSEQFTLESSPAGVTLAPGESATAEVRFVPSTALRQAELVIGTTYPGFAELSVDLAGKLFVW